MKAELDVVSVRKIRLDAAPPVNGSPSARVTFELYNESVRSLTDLVLALWLVEPPSLHDLDGERVVVAGPLTIRSKTVLFAGYSFDCEITLRNVSSSDCRCVPVVDVVEARFEAQ